MKLHRKPTLFTVLLLTLLSLAAFTADLSAGTAKVAWVHHGNQALADNGAHAQIPGDPGYVGNSFHRTVDTHEYWDVPVDIHMSGTLIQSYAWMGNGNNLLGRLGGSDFVDMTGGFYAENIAPYATDDMNRFALWYEDEVNESLVKKPGFPTNPVTIWIPERVWKSEDLMSYSLIASINSQYGKWDGDTWLAPVIVLDGETAHEWYDHNFPDGSPCHNQHKVHVMWDNWGNHVFVVFIDRAARDNWVWNDASVPGNALNSLLWDLRNDWDQEQVVIYGDDWEKAAGVAGWDFGQAGVPAGSYDHNIAWASTQDWIQPVHVGEVARWWGVDRMNDGDPNNDPPTIDITYTAYPELHDWTGGTYDNWYNDFKNTQAYDCGNAPDHNTNGVNGDYEDLWLGAFNRLMDVESDNDLSHLGWVTVMSQLYETAWHDWDSGSGGYELTPWDKTMWNHTRHGEAFAAGAVWLNNLGSVTGAVVEEDDFDGDGIDEYAVYNDRIFAIFDKRGARCTFMFNSEGECLVGNSATNWGGQGDWDDGGHPGFGHDSQHENRMYTALIDTLSGDRARVTFSKAGFSKGIALASGSDYIEVFYEGAEYNWAKSAVSPGLKDLMMNGYNLEFIEGLSVNGWLYAGYRNLTTGAVACYLWGDGQDIDYNNKGKNSSVSEMIELGGISGSYQMYLYGGSGDPEVNFPGPGDMQGPLFLETYQDPSYNILPNDRVLVATRVSDPSGIEEVIIHGTKNYPFDWVDFPMREDDGGAFDWDNDGNPDPGLYGIRIPPQSSGTTVVYSLKAVDGNMNVSWDSNNGENYSYTVGEIEFIMDGELDEGADAVAVNGGMGLWAFYSAELGDLYVATQAAGDEGRDDAFANDHFIFVSLSPDTMLAAPWSKSGEAGDWVGVLADENDGTYVGWFDESGTFEIPGEYVESAAGPEGGYLEGVIHLDDYIGFEPLRIYLAVGSYETVDGGSLEWQVPRWNGTQPDENIDGGEFLLFYRAISVNVDSYPAEVPAGATAEWDIILTNDSGSPVTVDYWIETEGTMEVKQLLGSRTVPAHESLEFTQALSVPGNTPAGMYTVHTHAGYYPDDSLGFASFNTNVLE